MNFAMFNLRFLSELALLSARSASPVSSPTIVIRARAPSFPPLTSVGFQIFCSISLALLLLVSYKLGSQSKTGQHLNFRFS